MKKLQNFDTNAQRLRDKIKQKNLRKRKLKLKRKETKRLEQLKQYEIRKLNDALQSMKYTYGSDGKIIYEDK